MPLCYIYAKCPFVCRTFSVFFLGLIGLPLKDQERKERMSI